MSSHQIPRVLNKKVLYESQRLILFQEEIEFSNGLREKWEHVALKGEGGVQILGLTDDHQLIFVREYRGAAGKYVLRLPTGAVEKDEKMESAARRELEEETGFRPKKITYLDKLKSTGSYFKSTLHIYLGTEMEETNLNRDPGEMDMEVLTFPLEKVYRMVENLEIDNPQTIYAILRLKKYFRESQGSV